jgi:pimeloyl-ACP methyl ester carboxylesterase
MALEHPARVASLVLIGAFATLKSNAGAEALWRDAVEHLQDPVPTALIHDFQQSCLVRPVPVQFFAEVIEESRKVPARVWRETLRCLLDENRSQLARELAAPTLIIWGDQDAFTGHAEQTFLAREIPHSQLTILSGVGHAPHWEAPQEVAAAITRFVSSKQDAAAIAHVA